MVGGLDTLPLVLLLRHLYEVQRDVREQVPGVIPGPEEGGPGRAGEGGRVLRSANPQKAIALPDAWKGPGQGRGDRDEGKKAILNQEKPSKEMPICTFFLMMSTFLPISFG